MDCVVLYDKYGKKHLLNLSHVSSIELTTEYERPDMVDYNAHITYYVNDKMNSREITETFDSEEQALQKLDQLTYKFTSEGE